MAAAPAALAGLTGRGAIAAGRRADLCVFAPDETFVVDPARLRHRNPVTPVRRPHARRRRRRRRGWLGPPVTDDERRGQLVMRRDDPTGRDVGG